MRFIRNCALALFALTAFATVGAVGTEAFQCSDVSGIDECASCSIIGVCYYSGGGTCEQFQGCGGGVSGTNCDGGGAITFCECAACG